MSSGIRARTSSIHIPIAVIPLAATTPIQDLVNGLTADGVFAKLDRLWVFAQATEALALVDLVASATATTVNSPTFAANVGYTGNGTTQYIDSNFNPTTAPSPHYIQDSATMFGWSNTTGAANGERFFGNTNASEHNYMSIRGDGGTTTYAAVNDSNGSGFTFTATTTDGSGLFAGNRSSASNMELYRNGSQLASVAAGHASVAVDNLNLLFLHANGYSARQICAGGFGESLTSTDQSNLYTRLRTYMTAVGVP